MAKATGIGGIFFKSADIEATSKWYERCLGIEVTKWEEGAYGQFNWREFDDPEKTAYTVWSPFKQSTEYFNPSSSDFMVNYRVDDLDAVLDHLRTQDVKIIGDIVTEPYGRFAWILDVDGRKVELWEQAQGEAADNTGN